MSEPRSPSGEEVAKAAQEAGVIRAKLEKLADAGQFDPVKHATEHKRLDELEGWLYRARKAKVAP